MQSDHKVVLVKIAHSDAPHIGKGRWSIPQQLFNNRPFLRDIKSKGKELLDAVREIKEGLKQRSATNNAQKLWEDWKDFAVKTAKDQAKKKTTYLDKLGTTTKKEI